MLIISGFGKSNPYRVTGPHGTTEADVRLEQGSEAMNAGGSGPVLYGISH